MVNHPGKYPISKQRKAIVGGVLAALAYLVGADLTSLSELTLDDGLEVLLAFGLSYGSVFGVSN